MPDVVTFLWVFFFGFSSGCAMCFLAHEHAARALTRKVRRS